MHQCLTLQIKINTLNCTAGQMQGANKLILRCHFCTVCGNILDVCGVHFSGNSNEHLLTSLLWSLSLPCPTWLMMKSDLSFAQMIQLPVLNLQTILPTGEGKRFVENDSTCWGVKLATCYLILQLKWWGEKIIKSSCALIMVNSFMLSRSNPGIVPAFRRVHEHRDDKTMRM